ncbi:SdpI family protein [Halorientalis halophila]|uniref:SdpI family protein n=1 Tax=Halorientalis halophila TaxID=3108499 RepID=UPI00300A8A57
MRTRTAAGLAGLLVAGMAALSLLVGPELPETMVTHWDASGTPDGTMPKLLGQFFLPLLTAGVVALLFVAPRLDPSAEQDASFRAVYDAFVVVLTAFLAVVHVAVLGINLGHEVPVVSIVSICVGCLVYAVGVVLPQTQPNWVVGIRTPWTLADETVWERTHDRGATLFKLSGAVAFLGAVVPEYAVYVIVGPLLASAAALTGYSNYLYRQRPGPEDGTTV